ncbi:MAG: MBL fold metallo-hydrolase [Candidatus Thioglobus sp.]|nr:MAG: MBL fold metallo-hydrolase [Candidatus Thioglobus sp.]
MKKISLISLILLVIIGAWYWCVFDEYKFAKIADNVYVMHGPLEGPNPENRGFMNNPGLIVGKSGVVIVDPGGTYGTGKRILAAMEEITKKPVVAVFNTHVHGDHWLGNQAIVQRYPNVRIYAHKNMIAQAKSGEGKRWVKLMNDLTKGASAGTIATYPTNSAKHLQTIKAGGEYFKIHHDINGVAHTNTDIMLEHIGSKTIFLGDNAFVNRQGRFDESSNMHGNIATLQYAQNLDLDNYVPGHGPSGNAKIAVLPFLNYLRIIQNEVKKGYSQDLADYEIKPTAHKKLSAYHRWHGYEAAVGKHIGKMLREIEALDE